MDLLLHLEAMPSAHNLKGLRQLFDTVESSVRALRTLGIVASSYVSLLSSILINKMPPEFCLIMSHKLSEKECDLESMMDIFQKETEAIREHSAGATLS